MPDSACPHPCLPGDVSCQAGAPLSAPHPWAVGMGISIGVGRGYLSSLIPWPWNDLGGSSPRPCPFTAPGQQHCGRAGGPAGKCCCFEAAATGKGNGWILFFCSIFSWKGHKKHLWLQPTASVALEPPGVTPPGTNPSPMFLSPLQRRPLQPRCVLGSVAGWRAEHRHAHSLLGVPALRRGDRSRSGKGTDSPGQGVFLPRTNLGCRDFPVPSPGVSSTLGVMGRARGPRCIGSVCNSEHRCLAG